MFVTIGVCHAIGVSNFLVHHLEQLKEDCSVAPHVNQVEFVCFQKTLNKIKCVYLAKKPLGSFRPGV